MKFEDKRLMEDKHLTSQIQIFLPLKASWTHPILLRISTASSSGKTPRKHKDPQKYMDLPLPAVSQSSTRMSSMKAWAGPTPLPQEMHLSWDNTCEMDPSADKPPFWFLQLRKLYSSFKGSISDFLHCLKLHFFRHSSVTAQNPSCHTTRGL